MLDTFIITTLTIGALAFVWVLLANTEGDDRETIVGVQRRGRTYFVRQDMLDRLTEAKSAYSGDSERRGYFLPWIVAAVSFAAMATVLGILSIA